MTSPKFPQVSQDRRFGGQSGFCASLARGNALNLETGHTDTPVYDVCVKSGQKSADRYGDRILEVIRAKNLTLREVAEQTGYTYEQIRRVVRNQPVASKELNDLLAEVLGFDAAELWATALRDKASQRVS